MKPTRREFLQESAAATAALGLGAIAAGTAMADDATATAAPPTSVRKGDMPYRTLGRTGEQVSLIGLGGYHVGIQHDEQESIRLIRTAIDHGINFLDNCWDYNDGESEVRMGKALQDGYRKKVFLMTKIDGRTKAAAMRQLDESLRRLQTDHLDLIQFHEVIRMEDPERIYGSGGAYEAMAEAKKAGKVRFVGFTGHKDPAIHLHMIDVARAHGSLPDTVQMPINVLDAQFRSFGHQVLPVLARERIGALAMKCFGGGVILREAMRSGMTTPIEMLHFTMSQPVSVVITGIDRQEILDQALEAARTFKPLTPEQTADLLSRTRTAAANGQYELFKTSHAFDGTVQNPGWMEH